MARADTIIGSQALAERLGVQKAQARRLLVEGRVVGAHMNGGRWHIPEPLTIVESRRPMRQAPGVTYLRRPPMPAFPQGRFRCHVVDPPWPMEKIALKVRPKQVPLEYAVMTLQDIARLPVPAKTDMTGCHLYLWTTQRFLPNAIEIARGWGFHYQCILTWVKAGGFSPFSWQYNTEHVVFATAGAMALNRVGLKLSFAGPRREHSRKPDAFYELVLKATPGPRMEWFGRQAREGFTVWGDEAGKYV